MTSSFDFTVTDENMNETLTQVRLLIADVILPRITAIECELRQLRRVTWPVCQSIKEKNQLSDIQSKREFFEYISDEEMKQLLNSKAKFSGKTLVDHEIKAIINN
jgi:hypothetical protein